MTADIMISGVGGQGILLVSEIIARAAIFSGLDVKKSEVHGVAQRGGAVVSHVRMGEKVYSPLISAGHCDVLLAFEKLEALRWAHYVKPGGLIIVNDFVTEPAKLTKEDPSYPKEIPEFLGKKGFRVILLPGSGEAEKLGERRVTNIVLVGALSSFVEIAEADWQKAIKQSVPEKYFEINRKAFEKGRELAGASLNRLS